MAVTDTYWRKLSDTAMRRFTAATGLGNPDDRLGAVASPAAAAVAGARAASRAYWGSWAMAAPRFGIGPPGGGTAEGAFLEMAAGSGARVPTFARQR